MKTWAYIRVSSDKQTVENQRSAINAAGLVIDEWLQDDGISGTIDWRKRKLRLAMKELQDGDRLVVAELSRLGRSLKQILELVEMCRTKKITLVLLREGITINDDNPFTKLLVSVLGSLAEMERNLISQRTKDALDRKRAEGVILGRPKGSRTDPAKRKHLRKIKAIKAMLEVGVPKAQIARTLKMHRGTLDNWQKEGLL